MAEPTAAKTTGGDTRASGSASSGPCGSGRRERRDRSRRDLYATSVKAFVALVALLGPATTVHKDTFASKLAKARRLQRKLSYRCKHFGATGTCTQVPDPPPWAVDLYLSSRSEGGDLKAVFESCMQACCRSRGPPPADGGVDGYDVDDLIFDQGGYCISRMQKSALYEAVDKDRLDLPKPGFPQMPVSDFLAEWPWCEVFSPASMAALRKSPGELAATKPPKARLHLQDRKEYPLLIKRLVECGLVEMHTLSSTAGLPDNGLFALLKPNGKQRLVIDNRPGNHLDWGMAALQDIYEAVLASDPERAKALGLPPRIMEIISPADIAALPSGAVTKTVSDFSNYFHQFFALEGSKAGQCLPAVDLGDGAGLRRPVYCTLPMGGWLAALLAHLAHKNMLRPMEAAPLMYRLPSHSDPSHEAVLTVLAKKADADGLVALADLPPPLLAGLAGAAGVPVAQLAPAWLASFRVPLSALRLQPASTGDPPAACISVGTHVLGDRGFEAALGRSRQRERDGWADKSCPVHFDAVMLAYIDDAHALVYPPVHAPARSLRLAPEVADAHRLAVCLRTAMHGVELNTKKLKWASAAATATIGVDIEFHPGVNGWPLRVGVAPAKRSAVARRIVSVLAGAATHITEEYFDHLIGKLVWATLVARPFLSVYDLVFRARQSRHRPGGAVWLSPRLRQELSQIVHLLPLMEHLSKPVSQTMYIFDASGSSRLGNGGYGVVRRKDLSSGVLAELLGESYNRLPRYHIGDDGSPPSSTAAAAAATAYILQDWADPSPAWEVMRSGEFERPPSHVNLAEASTGNMTVRVACAEPTARGCRVAIGGDNTAALCAFRKGRSSSFRLNGVCRRVAALTFVHGIDVLWFWVPSKANPADGPSRWWMRDVFAARKLGRRPRKSGAPLFGSAYSSDTEGDGPAPRPPRPRHPYKGTKVVVSAAAPARLAALAVKPATLSAYLSAWSGFSRYLDATLRQHADYATALESYVEMAWGSDGAVTKGDCINLLTGMAFVSPELKARGTLSLAWRAVTGWEKWRPKKSWNPITWELLLFFAVLLVWNRAVDAAIALLLSHHTYGRGGEITDLLDDHVALPGDPRCLDGSHGSILLYSPKAGRMQSVEIDDPLILQLVAYQRGRNSRRSTTRGRFFPDLARRGKESLLERFKAVQRAAGFPEHLWVRHSCRHGGATRDYISKRRPLADIMARGRWSSQRVCETYLNGAQAQYLNLQFPDLVRNRIRAMGDPVRALRLALGL